MSKAYFTTWRSRETCLAMQLTEDTQLPVEDVDLEGGLVFGRFTAGDFEIRYDGRVFGRKRDDHLARFEPARNVGKKGGRD